MAYTLTYSSPIQGWVSFYSYYPEWILGMNNYLYTFKGGDLYRHNVNPARNTFYEQWWVKMGTPNLAFQPSTLKSVFNDAVLENKLFKTLQIEGDAAWDISTYTDYQSSSLMPSTYFEKKEGSYFSYIRNGSGINSAGINEGELESRTTVGIGRSYQVNISAFTTTVDFSISPLIAIPNTVNVGDPIYFSGPPYSILQYAGIITAININYPAGVNQIVINSSLGVPIPIPDPLFVIVKNQEVESHGIVGHYCVFDMASYYNTKIELFTLASDVMKSFP